MFRRSADGVPQKGPCWLPVRTTARTAASWSNWDSILISSSIRPCDSALRFFSRSSSTTATLLSLLVRILPDCVIASALVGPKGFGCSGRFTALGQSVCLLFILARCCASTKHPQRLSHGVDPISGLPCGSLTKRVSIPRNVLRLFQW